ncbi:hypothetical protein EXM65_02625 [Clostridium botulinum]|uniref:Uncharacterized protein n=1 Tax=Clostridium botulinum TaxID=1491 RepID=A0A6M0SJW7_CLOBO|nr:hypothetical protein [Clostridium botulinum]MBY6934807.1 hypothetical protein [Clostridium botulinum]NFA41503.1 hypothetical protein [Clostridium botulinum]NFL83741.1 hypothetical protein [Clostridium botulinum]NFN13135.1 hypothetical protein [Clostridium botulinum]NFO36123.1 hypothetical protein [Clostridium botulinum]
MAVGLVQGKALIDAFIAENKEDINCDIKEMTSATNSSGNLVSRFCNIIGGVRAYMDSYNYYNNPLLGELHKAEKLNKQLV